MALWLILAALALVEGAEARPADAARVCPPPSTWPLAASHHEIELTAACLDGPRLTVAAVGDLLFHAGLQVQAYQHRDGFASLWLELAPLLAAADVTYGNLEGPMAPGITKRGRIVPDPGRTYDALVYTTGYQFNYHPSLAHDLARTGFDVVSTGNNHALDRGRLGIERTLDALDEAGIAAAGTRRRGGPESAWLAFTERRGFRLAWVACTSKINGFQDRARQVLRCFEDPDRVAQLIVHLATSGDVDAVIVTPHWGVTDALEPNDRQVDFARRWIDAGAAAVLGSHPHVVQRWERVVARDGREAFVIYSLGNFVSSMLAPRHARTLVLMISLVRDARGRVHVDRAGYLPARMRHDRRRWHFAVAPLGPQDDADRAYIERQLDGGDPVAPPTPAN